MRLPASGGTACAPPATASAAPSLYRIDSDDPLPVVTRCHCAQCARCSGSLAAFTACQPSELAVEGDPAWFQSSPDTKRGFCPVCGSALFLQAEPGNRVYVTVGTLDLPSGLTIAEHIHTVRRPVWCDILAPAPQKAGE